MAAHEAGAPLSDNAQAPSARYNIPVLSAQSSARGQWLSLSIAILLVGTLLAHWTTATRKEANVAKLDRMYVAVK
jgi:hypothetical protein